MRFGEVVFESLVRSCRATTTVSLATTRTHRLGVLAPRPSVFQNYHFGGYYRQPLAARELHVDFKRVRRVYVSRRALVHARKDDAKMQKPFARA